MQTETTPDRIVLAALELVLSQGVKRTNLAEVAFRAGVTRVTVYRYFGDKRGLVQAVCMWIAAIFQRAADEGPAASVHDVDLRLNRLGAELGALPPGKLLARLEEIHRLYPEVYAEFVLARQIAVDRIFQQALAAATCDGTLRDGLNLDVLKAIFWAAVIGLMENPALISSNVALADVFATVTELFRHGILKNPGGV